MFLSKGVTIYCSIILPIRYTGTLNENTGILLYHSSPMFYIEHAPDCAISSLPVFIFLGQFLWNHSDYKQHGGQQLRFQFGDKYKGQKSVLWIYTGVICQRAKLLLHYMGFWLLFKDSGVIELE